MDKVDAQIARVAARNAAAAPVFAAIAKLLATLDAAPVKSIPVINMLKYLEDPEHLFDPGLDADGWMRKSGVDPATGRDLFTQEVGLGPGRYLREARLLTAAHLVAETEVSGLLIGELVGFEQQVTFVRAFEAWLGCPRAPRSYCSASTRCLCPRCSTRVAASTRRARSTPFRRSSATACAADLFGPLDAWLAVPRSGTAA